MKRFLKFLAYTAMALAILAGALTTYLVFEDDIERWHLKRTYEVPTSLMGVSPGESKSDVIFRRGKPADPETCSICDEDFLVWTEDMFAVGFDRDRVEYISADRAEIGWYRNHPLYTTEGLLEMFGEPDILSISRDNLTRRYTYLDGGISYQYDQNMLDRVMIGRIMWRHLIKDPEAAYFVNGVQFCPGENCPWEAKGKLKPEYEGKSYKDLPRSR